MFRFDLFVCLPFLFVFFIFCSLVQLSKPNVHRRLYHFECQNETDPSDQQISIYENDKTLYRP